MDSDIGADKQVETKHLVYPPNRYGSSSAVEDHFHLQFLSGQQLQCYRRPFCLPQTCFRRLSFQSLWIGETAPSYLASKYHDVVSITLSADEASSCSWFLDNPDHSWVPPPSLLAFMESARKDKKPLVYIGFGSITVPHPNRVTARIIQGVVKSENLFSPCLLPALTSMHQVAVELSFPKAGLHV